MVPCVRCVFVHGLNAAATLWLDGARRFSCCNCWWQVLSTRYRADFGDAAYCCVALWQEVEDMLCSGEAFVGKPYLNQKLLSC